MITDKQKLTMEDFVEDLFLRYDVDFEARVEAMLGYADRTMSKVPDLLRDTLSNKKNNYSQALSKLQEAEYGCRFMKQKIASMNLDSLQSKLEDQIEKITFEQQKVYALWESPGTSKVIPDMMKSVADEEYGLTATLDNERQVRANFLTTAQFGQRLPQWPTEGSTVPDKEYCSQPKPL